MIPLNPLFSSSFLITWTASEPQPPSTAGPHPFHGPYFNPHAIVPFKSMTGQLKVVLSRSVHQHTHVQLRNPILFHQLRLVLHHAGTITTTVAPVSPLTADPMLAAQISPSTDSLSPCLGDPISLFLDKIATPSSLFTVTKTTNRGHYAVARARFGLPDAGGPADVLLWNTKGMITETSVRNLAFFRRGRWVTPHDLTGCLPGVMRRQLLEQGLVVTDDQGLLSRDNVREGELVIIFNAVEGCRIAVVHLRKV